MNKGTNYRTMEAFEMAAKIFESKVREDHDIDAMLLTGSYIHGEIDSNSDLDVVLLLKDTCTYRERGNTWINGIEVEYFKNPPQQIRSYFKKEKSPHTAHMLWYGQIVFHHSNVVHDLRAEAKEVLDKIPLLPSDTQIELHKYFLDDLLKDLEDVREDQIALSVIKGKLVNRCIDIFYAMQQVRRPKDKTLSKSLRNLDGKFHNTIYAFINEEEESTQKLIDKMSLLLNGWRSKEWVLRTPLDL